MRASILIIFISIFSLTSFATPPNNSFNSDSIYSVVEEMPEFKGGINALNKFLEEHITYPKDLESSQLKVKVFVRFVVDEKGKIKQAKVIRTTCDKTNKQNFQQNILPKLELEALQFINNLPPWNPGKHHGVPVKVWSTIPIVFTPSKV